MRQSPSADPLLPVVASLVVGTAVAVWAGVQSDAFRRQFLKPAQLQTRRRAEYQHRWELCLERAKRQLQNYLAANVQDGEEEVLRTELIADTDAVRQFVQQQVLTTTTSSSKTNPALRYRVGRIGTDDRAVPKELYLWLIDQRHGLHQVPLLPFAQAAETVLERQICPVTFCFVSDSSASVAGTVLAELLRINEPLLGATVLEQPLWMLQLAAVVEQKLFSKDSLLKIIRALCRLEARTAVAAMKKETPCKTLVILLPGMASTPALLPLLQEAFPDDRHVFAYTGCWNALQYATSRRYRRPSARRYHVPETLDEALTSTARVAPYTTPLAGPLATRSPYLNKKAYVESLAQLPLHHADVVETWMTSVDTLLRLQEEHALAFLPFVFQLDYLVSGALDHENQWEKGSDPYWSLVSLLQFVTGSKSRALPTEAVDAATSWLRDHTEVFALARGTADASSKKAVESIVFKHKRILIENKTLPDTVQPAEHWTLKAASKRGCACCILEEEVEEQLRQSSFDKIPAPTTSPVKASPFGMVNGGVSARTTTSSSAASGSSYVDGRMGFAFDPTRFA